MTTLKYIIGFIILFCAGFMAFEKAIERTEQAECYRWNDEAKIYPYYYFTDWQEAQCEHYGVKLELIK